MSTSINQVTEERRRMLRERLVDGGLGRHFHPTRVEVPGKCMFNVVIHDLLIPMCGKCFKDKEVENFLAGGPYMGPMFGGIKHYKCMAAGVVFFWGGMFVGSVWWQTKWPLTNLQVSGDQLSWLFNFLVFGKWKTSYAQFNIGILHDPRHPNTCYEGIWTPKIYLQIAKPQEVWLDV